MAITFVGAGAGVVYGARPVGTFPVPHPAGLAVGDTLIVSAAGSDGAGAGVGMSIPGWPYTLINSTDNSVGMRDVAFATVADAAMVAAGSTNITIDTIADVYAVAAAWRGGTISAVGGGNEGTAGSLAAGSINAVAGGVIVLVGANITNSASSIGATVPGSMTERANYINVDGGSPASGARLIMADELIAAAGPTGTRTLTFSGSYYWGAVALLAMSPLPTAGPRMLL